MRRARAREARAASAQQQGKEGGALGVLGGRAKMTPRQQMTWQGTLGIV
jgi:hypothetical protein